jgi:DNA-directed RNA polymerase specialized sigma24 family protein
VRQRKCPTGPAGHGARALRQSAARADLQERLVAPDLALRTGAFSHSEIMERLGLTYTNVNRQLVRGRRELERVA